MALIDKLTAIADAIREKTGKTEGLTLDQMPTEIEGIQSGGGGETMRNMISEVLSLVPVFDDTWTTVKFTLTSNQTDGGFTVPNPLGKEPGQIFAFKTNIDYSVSPQVIGGFNIGNITDDNDNNRTISLSNAAGSTTLPVDNDLIRIVSYTNWNLQSTAWGKSTADEIRIRAGWSAQNTLWLAGEYILAVK